VLVSIISTIIGSIIIFNTLLMQEHEQEPQKVEEPEIIDEISPYTNQALYLVVYRIRHRGLLDELLRLGGKPWKNTPEFFFKMNIDGEVASSKNISSFLSSGEVFFKTWDSIFQECKMVHDAEEEQETSDITLSIIERVKTGFLGRKIDDRIQEKIHLTYDYRTGRWYGDDSLRDDDGYGHYVGETFEVWFTLYQNDWDSDGIPYWTEVNVLGTDPSVDDTHKDPDQDGISTVWEWRWGYDPFVWDDHEHLDPDIDGIENIEEYQMEKWFADPFHQDIYVEVDGMQGSGLGDFFSPHVFYEEAGQAIIERYCQHNIGIYFDYGWTDGPINGGGEMLPHVEIMSDTTGNIYQFYKNNFADERKGIFRYCIICHIAGFCYMPEFNRYDTVAVGTNLKGTLITKKAFTERTRKIVLGSGVLHELGHTVGLTGTYFKGVDMAYASVPPLSNIRYNLEIKETWGQYYSVMNYLYIYNKKLLDYSDGSNGSPYDQNDWLHIFLPTFQTQDLAIESATFDTDAVDELGAIGRLELALDHWNYSKEFTDKYLSEIYEDSPVEPINCDIRLYVKTDAKLLGDEMDFRVYAQPQVQPTDSEYVLICEGYIDTKGELVLKSDSF
jgi:hypothetical protein